ncbi:MAG: hypothetical protein JWN98_2336 [Abditibacteriota bacterium]|nr:hypothetical protein [Abditibacteriota bacterium]
MSQPLRVLLVDDHEDMLTMLQFMMARRGYQVQIAASGEAALAAAPEFAPHVVVSDIGLPGINGYQLLAALRQRDDLTSFKAVALTGFDADQEDTSTPSRFDAQLTKPVDFESLFQLIEQLANDKA